MQSVFYQIQSQKFTPKHSEWEYRFVSGIIYRSLDDASETLDRWFTADSNSNMFSSVYPKRDSEGRLVRFVSIFDNGVELHYYIEPLTVL